MKGRVKSGLGLTIGADIEEEAASEDTLMAEDDNSEEVMEETAAEDSGPAPVMVKLTARHYEVFEDDLFSTEKKLFDCKKCDQKFDSSIKLKSHVDKFHKEGQDIDTPAPSNLTTGLAEPTLRQSKQSKQRKGKQIGEKVKEEKKLNQKKNKATTRLGQKKLKAKNSKSKSVEVLADSITSALDAVEETEGMEDIYTPAESELECDQCGELFDSIQTLDAHKFQNTC